jgi:hypothetical protein
LGKGRGAPLPQQPTTDLKHYLLLGARTRVGSHSFKMKFATTLLKMWAT